ncbi:formylglycine-generating enzyme family protein [bacterium]|nr:formylglycine-generating enzyme family protein [bacterium]
MKKVMIAAIAVLFCLSAFCAESWSPAVRFDGSEITSDTINLRPNDPITYSSAFAEGTPISLDITATDTSDPLVTAVIFSDDSGTAVEGTTVWNYTTEEYQDFPKTDTYQLTETVTTSSGSTVFNRSVKLLPEPIGILAFAILGALLLKKRSRLFVAAAIVLAASLTLSAKADVTVENVTCLQGWPFTRNVIINYTVSSTSADPRLAVKFYGTTDNGETTFDLSEYGTLSGDGADGMIEDMGTHKTFWTPNDSFYDTITDGFKVKVEAVEMLYMVVDLSGGTSASSYPVSYLADVPQGGWTSEYKTTKLVLRKVEPGTFTMGSPSNETGRGATTEEQHQVTLTKAFYIGVFEATQKQYKLVTGSNPSGYKHDGNDIDDNAVESVTYDDLRGSGANWPAGTGVLSSTFLGQLRTKTGLRFDLPTDAQWEYACRAETTTALNSGKNLSDTTACAEAAEVGRYNANRDDGKGKYYNSVCTVGSYLPNAWGLYDMHGNVWEWCLDYLQLNLGTAAVTDPKGPESGSSYNGYRVLRSGSWSSNASDLRSARRTGSASSSGNQVNGFRVALTLN